MPLHYACSADSVIHNACNICVVGACNLVLYLGLKNANFNECILRNAHAGEKYYIYLFARAIFKPCRIIVGVWKERVKLRYILTTVVKSHI